MRIKMDLLKHDKIWYLQHPEREVIDINDIDSEVDTTLIDTSIDSEPAAHQQGVVDDIVKMKSLSVVF